METDNRAWPLRFIAAIWRGLDRLRRLLHLILLLGLFLLLIASAVGERVFVPDTAALVIAPQGVLVAPGNYQIRLTVDGRPYQRTVQVRIDPRVRTAPADLTLQYNLSRQIDGLMRRLVAARTDLAARLGKAAASETAALQETANAVQAAYAPLPALLDTLQEADVKPLPAVEAAAKAAIERAIAALAAISAMISGN